MSMKSKNLSNKTYVQVHIWDKSDSFKFSPRISANLVKFQCSPDQQPKRWRSADLVRTSTSEVDKNIEAQTCASEVSTIYSDPVKIGATEVCEALDFE